MPGGVEGGLIIPLSDSGRRIGDMEPGVQKREVEDLMASPAVRKKVSIIRLQMVRESRSLYGMGCLTGPKEAVELVHPLFDLADREIVAVVSVSTKMEPVAVEIAAVGGLDSCIVDVKNLFKHALLSNAGGIMLFHCHPSGYPEPSEADRLLTERVANAGGILGIPLKDHVIIGDNRFFSFREEGLLKDAEESMER